MGRVVKRLAIVCSAAALLAPGSAAAYPWPLQPFQRAHPVRGNFGDPRTVFFNEPPDGIFQTAGVFSFHNGIDISAPAYAPVYPVASGVVKILRAGVVAVRSPGVTFQYWHLIPLVAPDERVVESRTLLGFVEPAALHVHLAELHDGRLVNPLLPGHLEPYADRTVPAVTDVEIRDAAGRLLRPPFAVCGIVSLAAAARDATSLPVPGAWAGLPVTPAFVSWTLRPGDGRPFVEATAADFLRSLPPNADFWDVYARGTFQNTPRVGRTQLSRVSGRFLFSLATRFDTTALANGAYVLTVTARDARGNQGTLSEAVAVANGAGGCAT